MTKNKVLYKISFKIGGLLYKSSGQTVKEALLKTNPKPPFKVKSFIEVSLGDKKGQMLFTPHILRRIFGKLPSKPIIDYWSCKLEKCL